MDLAHTIMDGDTPKGSQYELSTLKVEPSTSTGPSTLHDVSQLAMLGYSEPQDGTNFQELAPIDCGFAAWSFCACGFVAEMFIWGFLFR